MKHSYWIPTNRDIKKSLKSYLEEISYCMDKFKIEIPVFILDSGNEEIESINKKTVLGFQEKYPNIKLLYIPFKVQQKVISHILDKTGLDKKYKMCFIPETINYGAVMNKIYLLAAAMGLDVIHRRDSDTILQENCPFPLEIEIENIGKVNKNFETDKKLPLLVVDM